MLNADSDVGDDEDGVTAEAMMWLFVMRLFRMRCDDGVRVVGGSVLLDGLQVHPIALQ